jgi:cytidyltransferase-like protein
MSAPGKKILPLGELEQVLAPLRDQGRIVVHCHGVFDLLHPGHIRHFEAARRRGDILVVTITPDQFAQNQIATALNEVGALSAASVTTSGNKQALQNFLTQAIAALQSGDLAEARHKLAQAIERTDGCTLRGAPDGSGPGRDWITDCGAQMALYDDLSMALAVLGP